MNQIINKSKQEFESAISHLTQEVNGLRIGRAAPSMVENLIIEVYESKMPLVQLASINSTGPSELAVQPWDKTNLKPIEKALTQSDLGFSVVIQENIIRLTLPQLTEERRKEIIKVLHEKLERARITIRGIRDKTREEIVAIEKNKEIGEDDKYRLQEELNEVTRGYVDKIGELGKKKEVEIMTV
ncbi:ribosome recycling factor [Patescibacteria group bacterium]|nr:ribosome recycling factor [Patescibacteria group bacterium]MBU4512901.1 ribosome recycling factor [Patescibacteria group bacterium]MCG2692609.1 ribosome recycling factor [Candidatus Parcubacteria bacterium]